jgi:hypothetical protein
MKFSVQLERVKLYNIIKYYVLRVSDDS